MDIHATHKVICSFCMNFEPGIQNWSFKFVCRKKLFVIGTYLTYKYIQEKGYPSDSDEGIRRAILILECDWLKTIKKRSNNHGCSHYLAEKCTFWDEIFFKMAIIVCQHTKKLLLFFFDKMKVKGRVLRLQNAPHTITFTTPKLLLGEITFIFFISPYRYIHQAHPN